MTIEILPLNLHTLAYQTAVMDEDGNVIEQASFPHNRYIAARRWAKQMRRKYGGTIIDHTTSGQASTRT